MKMTTREWMAWDVWQAFAKKDKTIRARWLQIAKVKVTTSPDKNEEWAKVALTNINKHLEELNDNKATTGSTQRVC